MSIFVAMSIFSIKAQSPAPIVVQAASPVATIQTPPPPPQDSGSIRAAIKLLEEMRTVNEDTLNKQQAMLERLEDLKKAADQLKIFSHRTGG
jgi:hypothetical protein